MHTHFDRLILGASIRRYAPHLRQGTHRHDTASVTLVLRGMLRETVGRIDATAQSLSLVVKPAGVPHSNLFGPDAIATCQLVLSAEVHDSRRWSESMSRWRWIVGGPSVRAAIALTAVLRARHSSPEDQAEAAEAVLDMLADNGQSKAPPPWLPRVMDLLRDQVDSGVQRIRVADAAAAVGTHPVHLSRVFVRQLGCTVSAWVRRLRAQRAASQLPSTGEPLSAIAMRSGFADQSHMNRSFQRETALLPRGYRELVAGLS